MLLDRNKLERALRHEKAAAFQRKLGAEDRGEQRAATFEAGRVAGLRVALAIVEQESESLVTEVAKSA